MYVLKMKKHEKHAKKVFKNMHIIIKLDKRLNFVRINSLMQMIIKFKIFHKDQFLSKMIEFDKYLK